MTATSLYWPMFAQMALTIIVGFSLGLQRVAAIKKHGMKHIGQNGFPEKTINNSDNFRNQFEVPVLFYALCLFFVLSGTVTQTLIILAWVYVALRIFHAAVQLTNNIIFPYRFVSFVLSAFVVAAMLIIAILQLAVL